MKIFPLRYNPVALLLGVALGVVLAARPAQVLEDADTGWHIMAGEWIMQHGTLPETDPWSFTAGEQPWYNLSWAWDVMAAWLHGTVGLLGMQMLAILLIAGLMMWSATMAVRKGGGIFSTTILALYGGFLLVTAFLLRPHLSSFVMAAIFYTLLDRSWRKESRDFLWALPLLMIMWVNLHGGFLLGYLFVGVYVATALWQKHPLRFVYGLYFASFFLVTLVNPYGVDIFEGASRTVGHFMSQYIQEWQVPDLKANHILLLVFLIALTTIRLDDKESPLPDLVLAVILVTATMTAVRHQALLGLFAAPLLAPLFHRVGKGFDPKMFSFDRLIRKDEWYPVGFNRHGFIALVALASPYLIFAFFYNPDAVTEKSTIPPAMVKEMESLPADARILNNYFYGGYMIYLTKGKVPVFVDGRAATAYPDSLLKDYMGIERVGSSWQKILDKYHITHVLWREDTALTELLKLHPDWELQLKSEVVSAMDKKKKAENGIVESKGAVTEEKQEEDEEKTKGILLFRRVTPVPTQEESETEHTL